MSFRFQGISAILTYKTHLNKSEYIDWFTKLVKQTPVFIRLAHETGKHEEEEDNYEHTHVVFKLKVRINTQNQRFFDYNNIHCHIKQLKNQKSIEDAKNYISKEDPENKDLEITLDKEPNIVLGVWNTDTLQDALMKFVKKPSDVQGIISLFNTKKNDITIHNEDLPKYTWQNELITETNHPPSSKQRRSITWIVDKIGGAGKTNLARYLSTTQENNWVATKDLGTSKDSATVIQNALAMGWKSHGIIIDLPRQAKNHQRMYAYIEEIKDGFVTTQKYSGKTSYFNKPHLLVFANWKPLFYMLSKDRWDVRILKRIKINDKTEDIVMEKYIPTDKDFEKKQNTNYDLDFSE